MTLDRQVKENGGRVVNGGCESAVNGPAMAAFLGAGIGASAMGFFASANEAGLFAAPSLYAPAGGVSGRTTFAVIAWLTAWFLLHSRWKDRQIPAGLVYAITLALIGLGILGTFPPVYSLF